MLDDLDLRLLEALQKDANLTAQQLRDVLHLSPSQAGRRRQRPENDGFIRAYVAQLNATRLGLHIQGFIQVHITMEVPEHGETFGAPGEHTPGNHERVDNDPRC
ncbi:hypothetical protein ROLI_024490 [Roseobacter fucihabitans]|uniref:HTH asnC-type domain-containing protein n=1 Tax=Roseobacter fucihabitans TaxID=1537242 RepID=A0ABZ2BU45_9RHOB|nr:HTH-type transcriptional regulator LrpC [Roseobacter litoralis]